MKKLLFLLLFTLGMSTSTFSQGTVRGTLIDEETQEPLIGGTVQIEGSGAGAITDIDGSYSIQIPAGTYTIIHSYIGYQSKNISDVVVVNGEVNALGQVSLGMGGNDSELEAVVVTAYVQKNTEAGLLNAQRESTKIIDAVSAESIARTGDSDVAAVVKRVPGVTIEGGKYVYVRGLGDRYSKSILNGMQIPGLDPERNTVQMDIFPTNIIDNIVVYKTFSPDLPGDFSGGMVDVITKDFPLEKYMNVGMSFGYNSVSSFRDDFALPKSKGAADLFGFGNSKRQLPFGRNYDPTTAALSVKTQNTLALDNNIAPVNTNSLLNPSVKFSLGDVKDINGTYQLGYNFAASYDLDYNYKEDFKRVDGRVQNLGTPQFDTLYYREGGIGAREGLVNLTGGVALKNQNNKYSLRLMHTRAGESTATPRNLNNGESGIQQYESISDYFQRSISNGSISGEHYFGDDNYILNWGNSFTKNAVYNPDRNNFRGLIESGGYGFTGSGDSNFSKEWRDLDEWSNNAKLDLELPTYFINENSIAKVGLSSFYKSREFDTYQTDIRVSNPFNGSLTLINDINDLLDPNKIATANQDGYLAEVFVNDLSSIYSGTQHIIAGYVMGEIEVTEKLDFIGGARVENNVMNYKGNKQLTREPLDLETLNSTQFLPSANFVYELKEYMNLRASYNRTLARPSFKEKSEAAIYDPISSTKFFGNLGLVESEIDNYDLRWENYFSETEMFSISGFYKGLTNPIEIQAYSLTGGSDNITAVNKDKASVLGGEFEIRKNLEFISPNLEYLSFNGNVTVVDSSIDLASEEKEKYNESNVSIPKDRQIVGQSPYSINAGFSFRNEDRSNQASLNYNVKGKTLSVIGIGDYLNAFEMPVHRLDLNLTKRLGVDQKHQLSLKGQNLLNQTIKFEYEQEGLGNILNSSYKPGGDVSVGYSYRFH